MAIPIQSVMQLAIGGGAMDPSKIASGVSQASAQGAGRAGVPEFRELPTIPVHATATPPASSAPVEPTTWGHMAHQLVDRVDQYQRTASDKIQDVLAGGPTPVHEAMIAVEEASLSLQMLAEVRNKVIESYQEVMRMQV